MLQVDGRLIAAYECRLSPHVWVSLRGSTHFCDDMSIICSNFTRITYITHVFLEGGEGKKGVYLLQSVGVRVWLSPPCRVSVSPRPPIAKGRWKGAGRGGGLRVFDLIYRGGCSH